MGCAQTLALPSGLIGLSAPKTNKRYSLTSLQLLIFLEQALASFPPVTSGLCLLESKMMDAH